MTWDAIVVLWRPAIEIVVLAVVLYFAIVGIRGTRGAPVVAGFLLALLAAAFLALALDLPVISWLLKKSLIVWAMAGVVIFQPELRRMMANLGRWSLFTSLQERRETIEDIVLAVERLSEVRIGALIAIQQSIDLQEAVESGVIVDCEVTPEMVETIFFPNNPLHDGGIIIINDRIAFSACIFPLTQRQDLNKALGTRHRAAIGLSEETDAVVIAVSEETSSIAYAYGGQMVRGLTIEELRAFLTSVFIKKRAARREKKWLTSFRNTDR